MVREDTSVRRPRSWPNEDRLQRLAQRIRSLAETDEHRLRREREVETLRRAAARELHSVCADFVAAVNGMMDDPMVLLDPPEYHAATYSDDSPNLLQINVHGRILQVASRPPRS